MGPDEDEIRHEISDLSFQLDGLYGKLSERQARADPEPWIGDHLESCRRLLRDVEKVKAKVRQQGSQHEKLKTEVLPKRRSREQSSIRLDIRLMRMEFSILESSVNTHEFGDSVVRDISRSTHLTSDKLAQVNREMQFTSYKLSQINEEMRARFHLLTNDIDRFSQFHLKSAEGTPYTTSDASEDSQNYPEGHPVLKKAYQLCIAGLEIVFNSLECPEFKDLSLQLQAWAFGLLEGPHSLDFVIQDSEIEGMEPNHHPPWAEGLTAAFYRILLDIEIIVRVLELNDADSAAFLQKASLIVNNSPLSANAVNTSVVDEDQVAAEHVASCAESISTCIDHLFQLIPAVEVVMGFHCFHPEILSSMAAVRERHGLGRSIPVYYLAENVANRIWAVASEARDRALTLEREGKEKNLMDRIVGLFEDEAEKLEDWKAQNGSSTDPVEQKQTRASLLFLQRSLIKWMDDYEKLEGNSGQQDFTGILGKVQEEVEGLTLVSSLVKGKGKSAEMFSAGGEKRRQSTENKPRQRYPRGL